MWNVDSDPPSKIRKIFYRKDGRKIELTHNSYSTIDVLKRKAYVRWGSDYYEFYSYDHANDGVHDWVFHYSQISNDRAGDIPWEALEVMYDTLPEPKCECGSEKLKLGGHSFWCPKYSP